jgi:hypothetical protein
MIGKVKVLPRQTLTTMALIMPQKLQLELTQGLPTQTGTALPMAMSSPVQASSALCSLTRMAMGSVTFTSSMVQHHRPPHPEPIPMGTVSRMTKKPCWEPTKACGIVMRMDSPMVRK